MTLINLLAELATLSPHQADLPIRLARQSESVKQAFLQQNATDLRQQLTSTPIYHERTVVQIDKQSTS
jgi:hypothetical protein